MEEAVNTNTVIGGWLGLDRGRTALTCYTEISSTKLICAPSTRVKCIVFVFKYAIKAKNITERTVTFV